MQINRIGVMTGLQMAISGILGMAVMVLFHLDFGYWAVVTVAAIMSADQPATLTRGIMRCFGTIIGAVCGYLIAVNMDNSLVVGIVLFGGVLFCFMLIGLQKTAISYAGLIAGVTTAIIIGSKTAGISLTGISLYRSLEVLFGIIMTVLVGLLFAPQKTQFPSKAQLWDFSIQVDKNKLISALRISLTATLTYIAWSVLHIPEGFWITISCLFIMEEYSKKTQQKGGLRFLAHVLAAAIGLIAALLCGQNVWLLALLLFIGFFLCGYSIGLNIDNIGNMGNTTGVALAIMLLAGFQQHDMTTVISLRFINVCIGIGIGMLVTSYFLPKEETSSASG